MSPDLASERMTYTSGQLDNPPHDPFALVEAWMRDAFARRDSHGDLPEPTAMVLSTVAVGADGEPVPRSRTVLLKSWDADGFVFYTNRESAKGRELARHRSAALLLPWLPLQRQVRIEGRVELLDDATSDQYFASRPRGSQLGAWASRQSWPIASRADLEAAVGREAARFEGADVPRPPHWGGYRVAPRRFEFWQGRPDRLHDRFAYELTADGAWTVHRLQP